MVNVIGKRVAETASSENSAPTETRTSALRNVALQACPASTNTAPCSDAREDGQRASAAIEPHERNTVVDIRDGRMTSEQFVVVDAAQQADGVGAELNPPGCGPCPDALKTRRDTTRRPTSRAARPHGNHAMSRHDWKVAAEVDCRRAAISVGAPNASRVSSVVAAALHPSSRLIE